MRWCVPGVGALVGVLALTSCASTEVKAYKREANAICAAADKRLGKAPRPSATPQFAKVVEREITIREHAIAELGELNVPPDIGRAHAVIEDLESRQERAHVVKKAAEARDAAMLREAEETASEEIEFEAQRAKDADLPDCAKL
jgi:hypothetical protein